jgi:hypothetical protein
VSSLFFTVFFFSPCEKIEIVVLLATPAIFLHV